MTAQNGNTPSLDHLISGLELEQLPFVLLTETTTIAKCSDYEMSTADGRR
jgi:hypothetical protein